MKQDIWRYIAIGALGALGGLLTGQYNPNRNLVTSDQLTAAAVPLQNSINEQNRQIEDLKTQVSQLTGELKARDLISRNP